MGTSLILASSIAVQFAAAFLSLRLIPITGRRRAWIAISMAIFLMGIRRSMTLYETTLGGKAEVSYLVGGGTEWVTLVISALMLERLGYQVTARTGSIEAMETFRADPGCFDLVITDQTMPAMTGAELCRELLSIRPDIPIILCTGFSDLITPEKAQAMGIGAFMGKPLARREIAGTIRRLLHVAKH